MRALLTVLLFAASVLTCRAFPYHTNAQTFVIDDSVGADFDAFAWDWSAKDDQVIDVKFDQRITNGVGFRLASPKDGSIYLENLSFSVSYQTNIYNPTFYLTNRYNTLTQTNVYAAYTQRTVTVTKYLDFYSNAVVNAITQETVSLIGGASSVTATVSLPTTIVYAITTEYYSVPAYGVYTNLYIGRTNLLTATTNNIQLLALSSNMLSNISFASATNPWIVANAYLDSARLTTTNTNTMATAYQTPSPNIVSGRTYRLIFTLGSFNPALQKSSAIATIGGVTNVISAYEGVHTTTNTVINTDGLNIAFSNSLAKAYIDDVYLQEYIVGLTNTVTTITTNVVGNSNIVITAVAASIYTNKQYVYQVTTATVATVTISKSNMPPNNTYYGEFISFVGNTTSSPTRSLAKGQVVVTHSLFEGTNYTSSTGQGYGPWQFLLRDGTLPMLGNLNMGGYAVTNVANTNGFAFANGVSFGSTNVLAWNNFLQSTNALNDFTLFTGSVAGVYNNLQLQANKVHSTNIIDGTINADDISDDSIGGDEIGTDAVGSTEIEDETIMNVDVATNAAIAQSKIAGLVAVSNITTNVVLKTSPIIHATFDANGQNYTNGGTVYASNVVARSFHNPRNGSQVGTGLALGGDYNQVGEYSFVGGGLSNRTGSGGWNVIAGGSSNRIEDDFGFIGGGDLNIVEANYASVVGGQNNDAGGDWSLVGGGSGNAAQDEYATVIGGRSNRADAAYTVSAGRQAKATNVGAFVFSDSIAADYGSHGSNSFNARFGGGFWLTETMAFDGAGKLQSGVTTNTGTDGQVMTRSGTNVYWSTASGSGTFTNLLASGTNMTTYANLNRSATVRWDVDGTNGITANVTNLTAGTLIGGSAIATGTPVYVNTLIITSNGAGSAGGTATVLNVVGPNVQVASNTITFAQSITQVVFGTAGGILASNVGGMAYVSATNPAGSGGGEVNSRFVSVTWITNDLATYSAGTWYKFWPTNNAAVIAETDSNNLLSASGVYAPGTTGVFMVRTWNDELVGAAKTLSIGMYENGVLLTNHCGSLAHTASTGVGGGAVIGFNGDAYALAGGQWSDNGAFGFFCVSVATNTYEVGFVPWQGSAANLYRGHFTIVRVGSFP